MTKIFWDTNLFIYLFERNPVYLARMIDLRKKMMSRGDALLTSTFTLGEILVRPQQLGDRALVDRYLGFFRSSAVTVVPLDLAAAVAYARIRQERSISKPDAIQLACAAAAAADLFITNDDRLAGKRVAGVKFVSSLERVPL